jgi:hypothetical protein
MSTHVRELEKTQTSYIMAAIDRVVHHSVILDMMSVESDRAEVANHQHLHQPQVPLRRKRAHPHPKWRLQIYGSSLPHRQV